MHAACFADDVELVAAIVDLHAQPPLDLTQMLVQRPAQIGQSRVIGGLKGESDGLRRVVQTLKAG